jgi:hypothetical protein
VVKRWGEGRCGSCQKEGKGKSHGELLRGTIGGYLKTNFLVEGGNDTFRSSEFNIFRCFPFFRRVVAHRDRCAFRF